MIHLPPPFALAGITAAFLAVIAWIGDRRRMRRADLDKVGFMPWTVIFFAALTVAIVMLGLAGRQLLAG